MERIKSSTIVAFDVGLKTGVAMIQFRPEKKPQIQVCTVDINRLMKEILWMEAVINAEIWIAENFMLYPWEAKHQKFQKMDAPRVIGILMHRAFELSIDIVFQNAGNMKPAFSDSTMEAFGFGNIKNHEQDALKHALYYLKINRKEDLRCLIGNSTIPEK
jgi:hypothetical protein